MSSNGLSLLSPGMIEETERHAETWCGRIEPLDAMQSLMTDVCATSILGLQNSMSRRVFAFLYRRFQAALDIPDRGRTSREIIRLFYGLFAAKLLRCLFVIHSALLLRFTERGNRSILGLFHESRCQESVRAVNDDLLAMIVAARETTASALTWMLLELSSRPLVQRELREEYARVIDCQGTFQISEIRLLPRCQSFVFEVLRLHSPNLIAMKESTRTAVLGKVEIKQGEKCGYSPLFEHFNPELFPSPLEFLPDRFLQFSKTKALLSFGTGAHSCIGKYFAQMMMMIVLTRIVKRADVMQHSDTTLDFRYGSSGKVPLRNINLWMNRR